MLCAYRACNILNEKFMQTFFLDFVFGAFEYISVDKKKLIYEDCQLKKKRRSGLDAEFYSNQEQIKTKKHSFLSCFEKTENFVRNGFSTLF